MKWLVILLQTKLNEYKLFILKTFFVNIRKIKNKFSLIITFYMQKCTQNSSKIMIKFVNLNTSIC